jgi:hypothetical protein
VFRSDPPGPRWARRLTGQPGRRPVAPDGVNQPITEPRYIRPDATANVAIVVNDVGRPAGIGSPTHSRKPMIGAVSWTRCTSECRPQLTARRRPIVASKVEQNSLAPGPLIRRAVSAAAVPPGRIPTQSVARDLPSSAWPEGRCAFRQYHACRHLRSRHDGGRMICERDCCMGSCRGFAKRTPTVTSGLSVMAAPRAGLCPRRCRRDPSRSPGRSPVADHCVSMPSGA